MLRFDPFRDIDRLTEQVLGTQAGSARAPRFMPMDLYRSGDHYVLHADLPGIDPGSIDLSVDGGNLSIRAERTSRPEESVQWLTSERFSGRYMRQLSLGDDVDSTNIEATYHNGVLTVTLPVAERAKPRRIEVSVSDDRTVLESGETAASSADSS